MQQNWRELRAYDVLGAKVPVTAAIIKHGVTHRNFWLFVGMVVGLLVLLNTHDYQSRMSIWATAIVWLTCTLTLVFLYLSLLTGCLLLAQRLENFSIYIPIIGVLTMSANSFLTIWVVSLLADQPYDVAEVVGHIPYNIALGLIFEAVYFAFVHPAIIADISGSNPAKPTVKMIQIGPQKFPEDMLYHLMSQDHYVEIRTPETSQLIRGRLADAVSQIDPDQGILVHRSHWVAKKAISKAIGPRVCKCLELSDGTKVPVARSRITEVNDWLREHGFLSGSKPT